MRPIHRPLHGLILTAALCAALAPAPSVRAETTSRVQGTIVDRSGAPVDKAEIVLTNDRYRTRMQRGKSKKDGKWVFPFAETGSQVVSVNLPGHKLIKLTVESRGQDDTVVAKQEFLLSSKDPIPPIDIPFTGVYGFCKVDLIIVKEEEFVDAYRELRKPGEGEKKAEAGLPATAAPPEAGGDFYDQGRQLAGAGKHAEAVPLFQQVLAQTPDDPNALYALGRSQLEAGNSSEAEASLQKLLSLNPLFSSAHYYLGKAQAAGYKNAAAIASYRKEIENSPDKKMNLLLHIAALQVEISKTQPAALDQALATLEEVLTAEPSNTSALSQAADIYRQKGMKEKQEATYKKLVEADPNNAHVTFFNLGALAFNERRREEAEANFKKAIELNPKYAEAHLQLGYTLVGMNKIPEAVQHFEEFLVLEPAGRRGEEVKKLIAQLKK